MTNQQKSNQPNGFALISVLVCLAIFSFMMAAALRAQLNLTAITKQAYNQRQAYYNASTGAAQVAGAIEEAVLADNDIPDSLENDAYSVDVTQITETKYQVTATGFTGTARSSIIRFVAFDESYLDSLPPAPPPPPNAQPCDHPRWNKWKIIGKCKVKQNHGHHYHGYGHHHD